MKVVIADCSAIYTGRGDTTLARGVRSLIIKEDGSVSIHNEKGNKPLNYMKTANFVETVDLAGNKVWTYDSRKESLAVTIYSLLMSTEMPLIEDDPGLERDGTEDDLQEWLSYHPEVFGEGFNLVRREYPTGKGPVDLLVTDADGIPVAVEVKRVAMLGAVDQCRRYIHSLKDPESEHVETDLDFSQSYGILAAVDIRPKTQEWADKHKIRTVTVPAEWKEWHKDEKKERSAELDEV